MSLFIGIAASAIGFTAWPLIVPVLFILCGLDLYLTLFASLLVDCGNALVMTVIATRHRQIDIGQGIMLAGFALVWIVGGIWLGTVLIPGNEEFFRGSAGIITILIGVSFVIKGIRNNPDPAVDPGLDVSGSAPSGGNASGNRWRPYLVFLGVAVMAFHIGFFGIGGGMGFAISLMLFLSYPVLKATGTAMLITFCSTLFAAGGMFYQIPAGALKNSDAQILIPIMVGLSMVGTVAGAKIAYSLTDRQINFLIGGVVITAGLVAFAQKYILELIT